MPRIFCFLFCISLLLFASCRHHGQGHGLVSHRHVTTAFYHWKTTVKLSHEDSTMLRETNCRKLYVILFNVEANTDTTKYKYAAVPDAETYAENGLPKNMEIVPVVYITNEALKNMDSAGIPTLAQKLCRKVERLTTYYGADNIRELQIDCDWTRSTRDRYFYLLRCIKAASHIPTLSATIRLYQYKYHAKTGVPPVDRGVLMFYHMNSIRQIESKELILDVEEGKKYLNTDQYPLRLDYALPLFSEMVAWSWQGCKFYSPATFKKLMADSVLEKVDTAVNWYRTPTYADLGNKENLWSGEIIKLETAKPEDLKNAADLLSKYANSDTFNLIFFHLDKDANSLYTTHEVKDIISRFD